MSSMVATAEWAPSALEWKSTNDSPSIRVIPFSIPERFTANEQFEWTALRPHIAGLDSRIKQLKEYCEEDGITLRVNSENDFWEFIESPDLSFCSSKFDLVATDDGNLRAIYDDSDGHHIGVEFLGDRNCEYVVWSATTPPTGARATVAHTLKMIHSLLHH